MEKVVYSLVLSKEVVDAIDALAVQEGKSRSALINHVLAEYACLSTPEKQMQDVVQVVQNNAQKRFNTSVSSGGMLTLRTSLRYKYNPAISYILEMMPKEQKIARLRVDMRTQNDKLQLKVQNFFTLWTELEMQNLPYPPQIMEEVKTKKYIRILRKQTSAETQEQQAQAITNYINLLDDCLKKFFEYAEDETIAKNETSKLYLTEIENIGLAIEL